MTGRLQGFATRVEIAAVSPGLIRVWCALHQLDLVMQAFYKAVMSEQWYTFLVGLVGYLRRQQNLVTKMTTQCPLVSDTRWLSMVKAFKWFDLYRVRVMAYLDEKKPTVARLRCGG